MAGVLVKSLSQRKCFTIEVSSSVKDAADKLTEFNILSLIPPCALLCRKTTKKPLHLVVVLRPRRILVDFIGILQNEHSLLQNHEI